MVESFGALAFAFDVLAVPPDPEVGVVGGQFLYQFGAAGVVGVARGVHVEVGDGFAGDVGPVGPVGVEGAHGGVGEDQPDVVALVFGMRAKSVMRAAARLFQARMSMPSPRTRAGASGSWLAGGAAGG